MNILRQTDNDQNTVTIAPAQAPTLKKAVRRIRQRYGKRAIGLAVEIFGKRPAPPSESEAKP